MEELDFSTLAQANASHVSEGLAERKDDIAWRVRFRNEPLHVHVHVHVLVEFQSEVQRFMALRQAAYLILFYQPLDQQGKQTAEYLSRRTGEATVKSASENRLSARASTALPTRQSSEGHTSTESGRLLLQPRRDPASRSRGRASLPPRHRSALRGSRRLPARPSLPRTLRAQPDAPGGVTKSLTPVQRDESLLFEAVMILYTGFRSDDFPEHYVSSLARIEMVARLHELRTLDDPTYRFHRAKTVRPPADPVPPSDSSSLPQPLDSEGYLRLIAIADRRVAEAVDALWEGGATFAEDYMEQSAQNHMVERLRRLRAQESPAERSALVSEVNRLWASVWGTGQSDGRRS